MTFSRRQAIQRFTAFLGASPLFAHLQLAAQEGGQRRPIHQPERIPPLEGAMNAVEMEQIARQVLPKPVYDHIAAGAGAEDTLRRNHEFFGRITLRPRVLTNVETMDLSSDVLGTQLFTPILIGPTSNHGRVHPEGELATVAGAGRADTVVVLSGRSSRPADEVKGAATKPLWRQIEAGDDLGATAEEAARAVELGAKAVVLTVGSPYRVPLASDVHNQALSHNKTRHSETRNTRTPGRPTRRASPRRATPLRTGPRLINSRNPFRRRSF